MAAAGEDKPAGDVESGAAAPPPGAREGEGSVSFCDADDRSRRVAREGGGGSPEPYRSSGVSEGSSPDIDLESGSAEEKIKTGKADKECRICHMKLVGSSPESGFPIELGCACKGDLAAAHKDCAETWFRIRGNKICEICGEAARNVAAGELLEQGNESSGDSPPAAAAERRSFWRGHRFVNFLLACMVFAFVISWLFHFNGPG